MSVLIYPVDEVSDMDDIAHTVENLEDSVDWVIVRNLVPTAKASRVESARKREIIAPKRRISGVNLENIR